jgi:two-component system sensor kinase FixL
MVKTKETMNGIPVPTSEVGRLQNSVAAGFQRGNTTFLNKAEAALVGQNIAQYKALLGTIADVLFVIGKDGHIRTVQFSEHHEYALAEGAMTGKSLRELLPPQLAQQATYHLEKALRTGHLHNFTGQLLLFGKPRDFQASLMACGAGEVLAAVRDITDRKYLEKEVIEISHREQMRIGQDLHDGLGQHLTGITFLTRALVQKLSARELPEAAEAAEIGRLVLEALTQTRTLARGLFPVELESKGLAAALQELTTTVGSISEVDCSCECEGSILVLDRQVELNLFRLAQEALNNAVKHGKAKHIRVSLSQTAAKQVVLSIADDGVGLPPEGPSRKGLGLRIMSYRTHRLGGSLELSPREGGGTLVTCTVPTAGAHN